MREFGSGELARASYRIVLTESLAREMAGRFDKQEIQISKSNGRLLTRAFEVEPVEEGDAGSDDEDDGASIGAIDEADDEADDSAGGAAGAATGGAGPPTLSVFVDFIGDAYAALPPAEMATPAPFNPTIASTGPMRPARLLRLAYGTHLAELGESPLGTARADLPANQPRTLLPFVAS